MATNRPVYEVRLGRIKACVWANPTERGVRYNVTIARHILLTARCETRVIVLTQLAVPCWSSK